MCTHKLSCLHTICHSTVQSIHTCAIHTYTPFKILTHHPIHPHTIFRLGSLFWANGQFLRPAILTADIDGSNMRELISFDLGEPGIYIYSVDIHKKNFGLINPNNVYYCKTIECYRYSRRVKHNSCQVLESLALHRHKNKKCTNKYNNLELSIVPGIFCVYIHSCQSLSYTYTAMCIILLFMLSADLEVDWINDRLYWVDRTRRLISEYDLITGHRSVVLSTGPPGVSNPSALALYPYPNYG